MVIEGLTLAEVIALFGILPVLLTLWWEIRSTHKQIRVQTFFSYTQRYHEIALNLPIDIEASTFSLASLSGDQQEQALRWLRSYFDMCSEEFHLHEEKLVDDRVWQMWKSGMEQSLKRPAFREAWTRIQAHQYYDSAFAAYVGRVHQAS